MDNRRKPLILIVDDDQDSRTLIEYFLKKNNYRVITADSGAKGLKILAGHKPDIILLDVIMPGMDGFEFCTTLQKNSETAFIPVIFVTALGEERNKAKALSAGGVDYLVKPINKKKLLEKIHLHLKTNVQWKKIRKEFTQSAVKMMASNFVEFKESLSQRLKLPSDKEYTLIGTPHSTLHAISPKIGITTRQMAQYIADFLKLPYTSHIDPERIALGTLPAPFCRMNCVVAIKRESGKRAFVLSDPFNIELIDTIDKLKKPRTEPLQLTITQPENIEILLKTGLIEDNIKQDMNIVLSEDKDKIPKVREHEVHKKPSSSDIGRYSTMYITNSIFHTAVTDRASDIHVEPKKTNTVIRYRIDGDMREMFTLKKKTGTMLIRRLKAIGGMDISETRKPQDGTLEAEIDNRNFKLRLATTSTPNGESLIIRFLEPYAKPKSLGELGMTDEQTATMAELTNRSHGLILIVGPIGSGKTTTIYSLLSHIDCRIRSLVSIEDPVEYRIPFANQQQVNEKAGVTFDALLKSVVRQDPDIIFLGEVRDQYSAKMSVDFASTGHLTITSLHSSNATTAIFRLERLGIKRGVMADAVLCVVAQRLVKKLCPNCKKVVPISSEEKDMLSLFTDEIPSHVAHPVGCIQCNHTGYQGREGVFEILKFGAEISEMVRSDTTISEIRDVIRKRGDYLISNHAIEKVKNLLFSPKDAYIEVIVEEMRSIEILGKKKKSDVNVDRKRISEKPSILVVDDDADIQTLIATLLKNRGYEITTAHDGIDALVSMSKGNFDLIISDINMPNLDGFKLMEIKTQKGIETPVIFLTSRTATEDEIKGLELGAIDYIKKPIHKKLLVSKIKNFFEKYK